MIESSTSPNSLRNLKPRFSKWKNSATKTIRVPKVLADDILRCARILDSFYGSNEKLHLIPLERVYSQLDKIYNSKKTLKIGIQRVRDFLTVLAEENAI
jgi:hypothetical protein